MQKYRRNTLPIAAGILTAVAAAAAAASYATARYFVRLAVDREGPWVPQHTSGLLSGSRKDPAFQEAVQTAAAHLEKAGHEKVEITAHDGVHLAGHFFPHPQRKRVIIAMHGWRSSWGKDFGLMADFWAESGCSVLYAEQRGQNGSGGEYISFGLTERYDVLDWISWVTERCGSQVPIYLAGVSMGAATVLMAAGLDLPENVHGIIGDCAFTSPHAILKHVASKNLHLPYGLKGLMADALFKRRVRVGAGDYSTVEAMRSCRVPVLLIHGTGDRFVPIEMTYENYRACAAPKRLYVVPDAGHGMSYYLDREGYEAAVNHFWEDFDPCQCPHP